MRPDGNPYDAGAHDAPGAHDDVGAYVLHALSPAEEAAFENHLAGCEACRDELGELRRATTLLASAESADPPPELRQRILERVGTVRQEHASRPPRPRRRVLDMALAASLAAAVALGGITVWQHSRAEDARAGLARAEERARGYGSAFAGVLTASDATLHTERLDDGTSVAVVVSRSQDRAAFTAGGLPALTADQVYELWYAAEAGDLRPAGLLPGTGEAATRLLEGPLGDAVAVGITVEPAGGSEQPTTEPLGLVPIEA
ncbi:MULTISPECIES: anti-sigma factor domain-containing protein [unclassified Streptomyces]|uniref:anti-sigma factor n=1 Tax=unclassified Streptomyces TaxID=2593676 RepID=UPI0035D8552A